MTCPSLTADSIEPGANAILRGLSAKDMQRWEPKLQLLWLQLNQIIYEPAKPLLYIYLPVSTILSVQYLFEDGKAAEFAEIGNDGLSGTFAFAGNTTTIWNCSVMASGWAYQVDVQFVLNEFQNSSAFRSQIIRYMQLLMLSTAQTAVCNRRHSILQQLAKILLTNQDRMIRDDLEFTHELLARILGVRREGITLAAQHLQDLGAIDYKRGTIQIKNRLSLERTSCECYRIVKNEMIRINKKSLE
jgi:CRP-like cAMP-binding protein